MGGKSMKGPKMIEVSVTKAGGSEGPMPKDRLEIKNKLLEQVKEMATKAMAPKKESMFEEDEEEQEYSKEDSFEKELKSDSHAKLPENEGEEQNKQAQVEELLEEMEELKAKLKSLLG
jgi:hypothetical protein